MQPLGDDHVGHGDERGGVGRRPDEHVLVGQLVAGARPPRIDADDPHAVLLGELQVLQRAGAEGPVARAPAPHDHEPRVDVVGGLAAAALVVGLGAVGHADREHFGLGGDVRPELRAAAEHVEQPLGGDARVVQDREAAGPRAVEDGRRAVGVADAEHLTRDLVERLVPADPLELSAAARTDPTQRVAQAVGMVHALDLAEAAHARVQGRHLGGPLARVGADLHDLPVADVGVDHAAAAAVVAAGAGDHRLARGRGRPGCFVDDRSAHGSTRISPPLV